MSSLSPGATRHTDWDTYVRLLRYARPYTFRLVLGVVFGVLFGGSTTGMIYGLKKTFASMFDPNAMTMMQAVTVACLLPLFAIIRGVGDYLSTYFIEWVGNRVVMDLRMATFAHLQDLSLLFYTRTKTGELISRTVNDTTQVERAVSTVLGDLAKQPFTLIGMIGFLIWLDARLALISLVVFPISILPVALFGKKVRRFAKQGQQKIADIVSILQETITGARIVKAFGMEEYEKTKFAAQCRTVFNRAMRVSKAKAAIEPLIVLISVIGMSLLLLYTRWAHMQNADFIAFLAAMVTMYEPVKKLSKIHMNIQQSSAAADRIFELLDTEVTVKEQPHAQVFDEPVKTVTFEHVTFAYDHTPVLRDVNFTVSAGQCFALVGSSGSGKSTLVALLPRFYDVTDGRVLINGKDIRTLTLASLRRQIGIVTQETFLFNDTVANNIAYGNVDAPRDAVMAAAKRALAHDFIMAMPEGYDTIIGERGVRLSGGQCQRLSIARAILRNPPILLLDEATSALDTESERQVQAALNELMSGRTVFAIAHRLSTVTHADKIIVLDGGVIAEMGSHQQLLDKNGLYKHYYDLQFADDSEVASQLPPA